MLKIWIAKIKSSYLNPIKLVYEMAKFDILKTVFHQLDHRRFLAMHKFFFNRSNELNIKNFLLL